MKFILNEKESASVVAFNQRDWIKEYSQLSNQTDREDKINEFISAFLIAHNIPSDIGFRDALVNWILLIGEKGFKESTNPFLTWIIQYNKVVGGLSEVSNEAFNNLLDIYSNNIIFDSDLRGTSTLGTKSIIFNKDFYMKDVQDFTYLAQLFYYLNSKTGSRYFMNKFNSMTTTQRNEFFERLGYKDYSSATRNKTGIDEDSIKYFMVFEDKVYKAKGKLREAKTVSYAIEYLDTNIQDKEDTRENETIVDQDFAKVLEEAEEILTSGNFKYPKKLVRAQLDVLVKSGLYDASTKLDDIVFMVNRALKNIVG